MTPAQLQTVRRIHHKVARMPALQPAEVTNGEVVTLINIIHQEDDRATVAESTLENRLAKQAEQHIDSLLADT